MKRLTLLFAFAMIVIQLYSQETESDVDTLRKDALNVFMEASDYIKKEIPYINYVRDRKVADVYIISTSESTGSGGTVSTFFIVGQGKYSGMADTIKCNISPDDTPDIKRSKEVKALKMGLIRYIAKTPIAQYMNISFTEPLSETVSSDKWNSWVYAANLWAYISGQSTYNINYLSGMLSANRITEKSKFESSISSRARFPLYTIRFRFQGEVHHLRMFCSGERCRKQLTSIIRALALPILSDLFIIMS